MDIIVHLVRPLAITVGFPCVAVAMDSAFIRFNNGISLRREETGQPRIFQVGAISRVTVRQDHEGEKSCGFHGGQR